MTVYKEIYGELMSSTMQRHLCPYRNLSTSVSGHFSSINCV